MLRKVIFILSLLAVSPAMPNSSANTWGSRLRADASAFHADIAENHPGSVDSQNPGFVRINDAAFALALRRSWRVRDYAGYSFAMQAYVAAFDDGHVDAAATDAAPALSARWPGFLTGFDTTGRQIVMTRAGATAAPLGAVLESCDGRPAAALARDRVGAFVGRWFLAAQRRLRGGRLFVDEGNPFSVRPRRCTFIVQGRRRTFALTWTAIARNELDERLAEVYPRAHDPIGVRRLDDGTVWLSLSGFDGNPDSRDAKALTALLRDLKADDAAIRSARRVVLDLRGNNGGSSDWAEQIAAIVWGTSRVAAVPKPEQVDWRVSAATIAALRRTWDEVRRAPAESAAVRSEVRLILDGLVAAHAAGKALWRQPPSDPPLPPRIEVPPGSGGPPPAVLVVTDSGCGSACLGAADLWKKLGAIQVGQETNADTLYMDVRDLVLPSGLTQVSVPMKIYRDRARGSNVALVPRVIYPANLAETPRLERWLKTLQLE